MRCEGITKKGIKCDKGAIVDGFCLQHINQKTKEIEVEILVEIFQGIVTSIDVFKSDRIHSAEQKVLDHLYCIVSKSIKTLDDFKIWQENNRDGDYSYRWEKHII